jgi:intracellular sulfur oxidation DsrE/DsrF family protein
MRSLLAAALLAFATPAALAQENEPAPPALLTVITSPEPQTQLMALILTRASLAQGAEARVLLCDAAGDLALAEPPAAASAPLAPRGMSPHGLLSMLIADGVEVQVCAIYLPNSEAGEDDLLDGVTVAMPPEIAAVMLAPDTRLFTF